ncbi:PilC family type IV pilus tip adhesin [Neisseria sp.]|uniref:PilC family type IV pilus tip adhesin n=1 Tax=Neisseria sp. TaxID=192066 RepID=UPI0026DCB291|nr:PilC family type IV pilus tip adhesin [Neisseria sp.]MDO4226301.1 PilC family type IV pilus tip adhesin [Neisseria sp.]
MKKLPSRFRTTMRPIIYSLSSAFALLATGTASANFADTPIYLQNETKIQGGAGKVKPNVMLFIDDSGSMEFVVGENRTATSRERSRMSIAKEALTAVVNKYQSQINWNIQTLNNNGSVNMSTYTDNWASVIGKINQMSPKGGTPTTRRFYELSKVVVDNTRYRCQQNFILLMSDGDANGSQEAPDGWVQTRAGSYQPRRTAPYFPNNTVQDPYFGTRTGGRAQYTATYDSSKRTWLIDLWDTIWDRNDGLGWFSKTLATKDFKTSGTDNTGKSWNGDPADPKGSDGQSLYVKQIAETFTIGFGEGLTAAGRTYLEQGAASSHEKSFFNARSADELVAAIGSIFQDIENSSLNNAQEGVGTAAPAVTGSGTSEAPSAALSVYLDPQTWSSQLRFYELAEDGSFKNSFKQPSFAGRKTLVNTGTPDAAGKSIFWADALSGSNADFGISGTAADEWKNALIPWTVRGSKADSVIKAEAANNQYSQTYRDRNLDSNGNPVSGKRDLGDILDSGITTIGKTVNGRQEFLLAAANDGMVHLFQSSSDTNHPYSLKLSYIPAGMERDSGNGGETLGKTLKELAVEGYGASTPHRYMVNGGFVVRQTPAPSGEVKGQQTVMFGAMGQGGRGAYALNIGGTDRKNGTAIGLNAADSSWDTQVPLFETAKGTNNTLGYTVGTPQIGRISIQRPAAGSQTAVNTSENVRYAAFLASGYRKQDINDAGNETALYVYDLLGQEAATGEVKGAKAGELIKKIEVSDGKGGLSSPTLLDTDFDGIIDIAYAGDYGGNMYRFDLRGENPSNWKVERIYTGSATQPITSAPAVSRQSLNKYVVIFGTGSDIYQSDATSKTQQAIFGIFDDLTISENTTTPKTAATIGDLLKQTLTVETIEGKSYRFLTNNSIESKHKGWKIDLGATDGERVVVKPTMILRSALVNTRIYKTTQTVSNSSGDVCIPETTETKTESNSWDLMIHADTGGALSKAHARIRYLKQDGTPILNNSGYFANGQMHSGIDGTTYVNSTQRATDSPVTLDGDSGGSGTDSMLSTSNAIPRNQCFIGRGDRFILKGSGSSFAVDGRNCGVRRISWREIF